MLTDFIAGHETPYRSTDEAEPTAPTINRYDAAHPAVEILPKGTATRRAVTWPGMGVEVVQISSYDKIDFRFRALTNLLVVYERGARRRGETFVEGLRPSTLQNFARKLTLVPAGHEYREWLEPRTNSHLVYFYFDAIGAQARSAWRLDDVAFAPQIFFEEATVWNTALKLKRLIEKPVEEELHYLEALGTVLVHELVRLNRGAAHSEPPARGGLAAWQQRVVTEYVEEHLAEPVSLATLANLVNLSPSHFCRAFKQSFGIPPHRYHTSRRIERAKAMLARRAYSVTDIGLTVGYSETSSFTAAFRKATGVTPTAFHRNFA